MIFFLFLFCQYCACLDVHLTRQRGLKMAIIGSDAPEFYKLVSIIVIYLKMPVYVGNAGHFVNILEKELLQPMYSVIFVNAGHFIL